MTDTNGNTPFAHTDKKAGDIIQSKDWNSAMNEVMRLETAKVNRQGADTIQGPLTIEAALTLNDKVGIGGAPATGPTAEKLKVTGNTAIAGNLSVTGGSSNNLTIAGTSKLTSNVGIGIDPATGANAETLKVAGNTTIAGNLTIHNSQAALELKAISGSHGRHAYLVSRPNSFNAYSTDLGFKVRQDSPWRSEEIPDAMTIAYTGNVGIGTTTPTKKLEVNGEALITGQLSASAALSVTGNSTLAGSLTVNNTVALKGSTGGTGLAVNASGNVGIGVSSPTTRLDVRGGSLQLEGDQKLIFQDSGTSNNLKLQLWSGYGLGINSGTLFYTAEGNHSWRDKDSIERMKLTTIANGGLSILGTGKSSFAGDLEISGNVGIGSAPATGANAGKLKVTGHAAIVGDLSLGRDSANQKFIIHSRTNSSGDFLQITHDKSDGDWDWGQGITLKRGGNVGIGTNNPTKKLEVKGHITMTAGASNHDSYYALATADANTLIFGGVYKAGIYFYWKSDDGKRYGLAIGGKEVSSTDVNNLKSL